MSGCLRRRNVMLGSCASAFRSIPMPRQGCEVANALCSVRGTFVRQRGHAVRVD